MSSSNSHISFGSVLVADASVSINIIATGFATEIISAIPCSIVTTTNALMELRAGNDKGHRDFDEMQNLIGSGLVKAVGLSVSGRKAFRSMVDGSALTTLDDGEAATISYASEIGGLALIDERKARSLCAKRYPGLVVISTAELLLHQTVSEALGPVRHVDAMVNALQRARMRVPSDFLTTVVDLIGFEHASTCRSLPAVARKSAER